MSIGNRIFQLRKKHEMTQRELGKLLGVTKSTVLKYETNQLKLRSDTIAKLCVIFEVSPDRFVFDNYEETGEKHHEESSQISKS